MVIKCGVPQGSLLGPLLFSIFVNDMPGNVQSCDVALYADDTCIFTASKDPSEVSRKLNEDLSRISCWRVFHEEIICHHDKLQLSS